MAITRHFQPGQSQYVSQYVPLKLPFELWSKNLADKDASIESAIQQHKSLYGSEVAGIDKVKLGEYGSQYYGNDPKLNKFITDIGEVAVNDRTNSISSAQAIDAKLDELLADDYLMKAATGELANELIQVNQMKNQHNALNEVYKKREAAVQDIYKGISTNKDWELDPTLLMEQEREIQQMKSDPNYVPRNVGIGDYFDSSKYILDELSAKKDSGGKSYDTSDPAYLKWSASHGVSAGEYAAFATDIFNNEGSQVRRNAERKVDELIRSGHLKPENRQAALDYELNQLIETGINLQHKTSDKGMSEKSQFQREYESGSQMFVKDQADQQVFEGTATSFNQVNSTFAKLDEAKTGADQYIQTKFGISPEAFIALDSNGLQNLANQLGLPASDLKDQQQQYFDLVGKHYETQTIVNINKSIIEQTSGYTDSEKSTESLINLIKQNPTQAQQYLLASQDPTNPQYSKIINSPEYKEFQTIKQYNPTLYNSLSSVVEDGNILALYSAEDFKSYNGVFNPDAANSFLRSQGIETGVTVGSPKQLTETEFNRLLRTNSGGDLTISNTIQDINQKKNLSNQLSNTVVPLTDKHLTTSPGLYMNISPQYLDEMSSFSNPYASELVSNGKILENPALKDVLIKTIFNQKTPMGMTMVGTDTYIVEGMALNSLLTDTGNYQVFLDEYARAKYDEPISDLSEEQVKEMNAEVKSFMSNSSAYQLKLKVDQSSGFTDFQSNQITENNSKLNWSDPSQLETNQRMVYTENVINNKTAIEQAHVLSNNAAVVNTGETVSPNLPKSQQVPFSVNYYVGGQPKTSQWVVTGITQSIDPSTAGQESTVIKNSNGTTNTYENIGVIKGTSGQYYNESKVYIYTVSDPNGNLYQVPAHSFEEALEYISNTVNSQ